MSSGVGRGKGVVTEAFLLSSLVTLRKLWQDKQTGVVYIIDSCIESAQFDEKEKQRLGELKSSFNTLLKSSPGKLKMPSGDIVSLAEHLNFVFYSYFLHSIDNTQSREVQRALYSLLYDKANPSSHLKRQAYFVGIIIHSIDDILNVLNEVRNIIAKAQTDNFDASALYTVVQ